jgi:hypothetical protein
MRKTVMPGWRSLILAVVVALGVVGCASTNEEDSYSDRPWNSPKGWEHGLPSGFYEGR